MMDEEFLKLEDDFSLEERSYISAKVDLGKSQSAELDDNLNFKIKLPTIRKKKTLIIEDVSIKRGSTGGGNALF
jgi:hypothetical protein